MAILTLFLCFRAEAWVFDDSRPDGLCRVHKVWRIRANAWNVPMSPASNVVNAAVYLLWLLLVGGWLHTSCRIHFGKIFLQR